MFISKDIEDEAFSRYKSVAVYWKPVFGNRLKHLDKNVGGTLKNVLPEP